MRYTTGTFLSFSFDAVALLCSSHAANNNNANAYLTSAEAAEAPAPEEPKAPTPPPPPPKGNPEFRKKSQVL